MVVLIIAVLAAIAVPLYLSSVETAEEAAADATCSNALSMYTSAAFEEGGYSAGMGEQVVQALNGQSDEYTVTVAGGDGTDNISFSVDYGGDAPATCEGVSI
ncbi:hypothetical protein [Nesterenkonia sp. NBAIMH1]|uniref:hypothetical protein n=1 Tax=Nesterenkonia sp. NBAIMH1 TaxID=2600320 RepID=UPI0011B797CD|nr:hypothetical protein [Nesterenkonia sp. NBAIMH1]